MNYMGDRKAGHKKNDMSIGVSVRATKFAPDSNRESQSGQYLQ